MLQKEILSKKAKLNNGYEIPVIGLGTYRTDNDFEALKNSVRHAFKCGYRHIDTAWFYNNEKAIGEVLKEVMKNQGIKREEIFVTSKVWNAHHSKNLVRKYFEDSLSKLQLNYIDLYLIHWPISFKETVKNDPIPLDEHGNLLFSDTDYLETYTAMEELVKEGKVRSIGVSNFNIRQLTEILENCEIKPVVNQFEVHPYLHNEKLVQFCQNNGITVEAYASIGSGEKTLCSRLGIPFLLENDKLKEIAKKHKKTTAQICLRWAIERNLVVLPKSVKPHRIEENIQIFDFQLDEEDMKKLKSIDYNIRIFTWPEQKGSKFYPFLED